MTTAADGTFAWEAVPAGTCSASVDLPGRGTFRGLTTSSPRPDPWVVRLPATCTLRGRVTDSTGAGIADVDLLVTTGGSSSEWVGVASELKGRSGPDGAYRIEGACPGPVRRVFLLPPGAHLAEEQTPQTAPWSFVQAKARQRSGARPRAVPGGCHRSDRRWAKRGSLSTAPRSPRTRRAPDVGVRRARARDRAHGREGRARIEGLALEKHLVHVRHATHYLPEFERAPRRLALAPDGHLRDRLPPAAMVVVLAKEGEVAQKTLRLARGVSVAGRVTGPDGTPVPGATVARVRGQDANRTAEVGRGLSPVDPMACARTRTDDSVWTRSFPRRRFG